MAYGLLSVKIRFYINSYSAVQVKGVHFQAPTPQRQVKFPIIILTNLGFKYRLWLVSHC